MNAMRCSGLPKIRHASGRRAVNGNYVVASNFGPDDVEIDDVVRRTPRTLRQTLAKVRPTTMQGHLQRSPQLGVRSAEVQALELSSAWYRVLPNLRTELSASESHVLGGKTVVHFSSSLAGTVSGRSEAYCRRPMWKSFMEGPP